MHSRQGLVPVNHLTFDRMLAGFANRRFSPAGYLWLSTSSMGNEQGKAKGASDGKTSPQAQANAFRDAPKATSPAPEEKAEDVVANPNSNGDLKASGETHADAEESYSFWYGACLIYSIIWPIACWQGS